MALKTNIIKVALLSPFRRLFDYIATNNTSLKPGTRLSIPFGNQKGIVGIAIKTTQQSDTPAQKLRSINYILDEEPVLNTESMGLCQWCADYYHYPLGEVCHLALPALLRKTAPIPIETNTQWAISTEGISAKSDDFKRAPKQQKALLIFQSEKQIKADAVKQYDISTNTLKTLAEKKLITRQEIPEEYSATPTPENFLKERPLTLNPEQQQALDSIQLDRFNTYLLDGVTGSGKTEVYLQVIERTVKNGQQVLVLVPEIGLTPQITARFENRFKLSIATLHSGLSDKRRFDIWQASRHGQLNIVIGTRSSIFTQLPNLGLIVVDEEHDLSYKQQEGVRYSARDLAIVRAQKLGVPLLLGSATPSLESLHNALSGRYQHVLLRQRAQNQPLPAIECINTSDTDLSERAIDDIRQTIQQGQQVLIFINRRGYAPVLMCQDCNWISQCPNCDSRMTLHRINQQHQQLHCHHCDHRAKVPKQCPQCHSGRLQPLGTGTQRSEEQLDQIFKNTPIIRIDRDSISRKGELESALKQVNSGEPCILVGTQMLAKGHHFANLGLGVILGLDQAFFSSDFRGAERMGQLLTQVAGRIGRENHKGRVLIQTRFIDHPLLELLLNEGYQSFAQTLLDERKSTGMPPYEHIAVIRCHAQQPELSYQFLLQARQQAEQIIASHNGLQYLGPFPATMEKRNNRYHFILQIKLSNRRERQYLLQRLCEQLENSKQARGLHWLVDIDPQEF